MVTATRKLFSKGREATEERYSLNSSLLAHMYKKARAWSLEEGFGAGMKT